MKESYYNKIIGSIKKGRKINLIESKLYKPTRHRHIIELLAIEGPKSAYDIEKTLNIPHSSLNLIIKDLLEVGLIKIKGEERFRTGLSKKLFSLTSEGVLSILKIDARIENDTSDKFIFFPKSPIWENLETVIQKNKDLLFAFEEWDKLKKINAEMLGRLLIFYEIENSSFIKKEHFIVLEEFCYFLVFLIFYNDIARLDFIQLDMLNMLHFKELLEHIYVPDKDKMVNLAENHEIMKSLSEQAKAYAKNKILEGDKGFIENFSFLIEDRYRDVKELNKVLDGIIPKFKSFLESAKSQQKAD